MFYYIYVGLANPKHEIFERKRLKYNLYCSAAPDFFRKQNAIDRLQYLLSVDLSFDFLNESCL